MARINVKYYSDIPRRGTCDCPFPVHELHSNARLGRATLVRTCCMAVKLGGGSPTFNGVTITDFVDFYDFTHKEEVKGMEVE